MSTETGIMRDILVAVNQIPDALFWRVNVGLATAPDGRKTRYGLPGQADIAGVIRGHHVEIEVKTPTGRQSRQQIRCLFVDHVRHAAVGDARPARQAPGQSPPYGRQAR